MADLRLEYLDPATLTENPQNWRRHPAPQINALKGVLAEVGWAGALLYNERTGRLIDGHARKQVAAKGQKVPVLVGAWDEADERKILATLDPLGAMATADQASLLALLESVTFQDSAVGQMLEALAAEAAPALPAPKPDPGPQLDRAAELQAHWGTQRGQVWQVGRHRLMCGDSERGLDSLLDGATVNALLTDPPYGISIVKGLGSSDGTKPFGRVRQPGGKPSGVLLGKGGTNAAMGPALLRGKVGVPGVVQPRLYHPVHGDDQPFDPAWLLDLAPVVILFGANHYASRLPDSAAWLVWDKGVSDESSFSACELIWTNLGNHVRRYEWRWSGMIRKGDRATEMAERIHPTQKPVGLIAAMLNDLTQEGDVVLDPYLGSGTVMVACEQTGRVCYGGEYSEDYVAVCLERMSGMGLTPRLL